MPMPVATRCYGRIIDATLVAEWGKMKRLWLYFQRAKTGPVLVTGACLVRLSSLLMMGCAGVKLRRNMVHKRLYTTAENAGTIWRYLSRFWRGSGPKLVAKRRSLSTQHTSRHIAQPPPKSKKRAFTSTWLYQKRYEMALYCNWHDWAANPDLMNASAVSEYTKARALVSNHPATE